MPNCTNTSVISSWPLERRAAQLIVIPTEEDDVESVTTAVRTGIGGVILFGSDAPANLGQQISELDDAAPAGLPPLVMTDEEGGEVQRMANLVGSLPWPRTMASTMTVSQVEQMARSLGVAMKADGVDMDLAPVLDIASGPGPDAEHTDGPRSFSPNPQIAAAYGIAFAEGLEAGGVVPVVKHFPGEGNATANTDDGVASLPPYNELQSADLLPFEAAVHAGLPAVMVGNATVPGLTTLPASLSSSVIEGILRGKLGFSGLIMTDSLSAGAIADIGLSVSQAAVNAIAAGADMILFNASDAQSVATSVVQSIITAVQSGVIKESQLNTAVATVVAAKGADLCAQHEVQPHATSLGPLTPR
jgi:beta-N-acetylhexosaminidase